MEMEQSSVSKQNYQKSENQENLNIDEPKNSGDKKETKRDEDPNSTPSPETTEDKKKDDPKNSGDNEETKRDEDPNSTLLPLTTEDKKKDSGFLKKIYKNPKFKHLFLAGKFLASNVIMVASDVSSDITTAVNFFILGDFFEGLFTSLIIFAPFTARVLVWMYTLFEAIFMCIKNGRLEKDIEKLETHLRSFSELFCHFPLVHPLRNLRGFFALLLMDTSLTQNSELVTKIKKDALSSGLFEAFLESTPQLIFQCSVILRTGNTTKTQTFSVFTSFMSLSKSSARLFYTQRIGRLPDVDAGILMIIFVLPVIMFLVAGPLFSLILFTAYFQAYVVVLIIVIMLLNFIVLKNGFLKSWLYPDVNHLYESSYLQSDHFLANESKKKQAEDESQSVFFTAILTSWVSPTTVWGINFKSKSYFLIISALTSLTGHVMGLACIYIYITLTPFSYCDRVPISHCFKSVENCSEIKYQEHHNQNSFLGKFKFCASDEGCLPWKSICSDWEHPTYEFFHIVGANGFGLLLTSLAASICLQSLGNYNNMYRVSKFLFCWGCDSNKVQSQDLTKAKIEDPVCSIPEVQGLVHGTPEVQCPLLPRSKSAGLICTSDKVKDPVCNKANVIEPVHATTEFKGSLSNTEKVRGPVIVTIEDERLHHPTSKDICTVYNTADILSETEESGTDNKGSNFTTEEVKDAIGSTSEINNTVCVIDEDEFAVSVFEEVKDVKTEEKTLVSTKDEVKHSISSITKAEEQVSANEKVDNLRLTWKQKVGKLPEKLKSFRIKPIVNGSFLQDILINTKVPLVLQGGVFEKSQEPLNLHNSNNQYFCDDIEAIIEKLDKSKVHYKDPVYGETALHVALNRGHSKLLKIMAKSKCDFKHTNKEGQSVLYLLEKAATDFEDIKAVLDEVILVQQNKSEKEKVFLEPPMHQAVQSNNLGFLCMMVTIGGSWRSQNDKNVSVIYNLWDKIESGKLNISNKIFNYIIGTGTCQNWEILIHIAASKGWIQCLERILNSKINLDLKKPFDLTTPLHCAIESGRVDIARLLINNKANVNALDVEKMTPLHFAAKRGFTACAQLLIDNGADIHAEDIEGNTPLHMAVESDNLECCQLLINKGAKINKPNWFESTPLHIAVQIGFTELVKVLIDNKANINAEDNSQLTPLLVAIDNAFLDCAELLIEKQADVNVKDGNGQTPLHYAIQDERTQLAKLLIENNAMVNSGDNRGRTPLHYASRFGLADCITLLLENGADAATCDESGNTPLHAVVSSEYANMDDIKQCAENLIRTGADFNCLNKEGKCPLDFDPLQELKCEMPEIFN